MNLLLVLAGLALLVLSASTRVRDASRRGLSFGMSPRVAWVLGSARLVTSAVVLLRQPRSGPVPS